MASAVPSTAPMMMDVLCEEDDGLDWGEELAGDVERGRDEPLLGEEKEEEAVRGVEESVIEAEEE